MEDRRFLLGALPGATVLAVVVLLSVLAIAGGLWWRTSRTARRVTVLGRQGEVQFTVSEGIWEPLNPDVVLRAGQRVKTGPDGRLMLAFFEGSTLEIGPDTEIQLATVNGGWGGRLQVELEQASGWTSHVIEPLQGRASLYEVRTPVGIANVAGTRFRVRVESGSLAHFDVDAGRVTVLGEGEHVDVRPGQRATVRAGQPPDEPAFRFLARGTVEAVSGTTWSIQGVPVTVGDQTGWVGEPGAGDGVLVQGRVLDDGRWLADRVEAISLEEPAFRFAGPLASMDGDIWQVGPHFARVDERTALDADLTLDSAVQASVLPEEDGVWRAVSVELLQPPSEEPHPTETPDPGADPSFSFEPDELELAGCERAVHFEATLVNGGVEPGDAAANVSLGYLTVEGDGFVESVALSPAFWQRIPAGGEVHFDVQITLSEAWNQAPVGEEVQVRVLVAGETNRPERHPAPLSLRIVSQCPASIPPGGGSSDQD